MLLPRSYQLRILALVAAVPSYDASPVDVTALFPPLASPLPPIGSAQWSALYPPTGTTPPARQIWLDALQQVVHAGLLPPPDVVPVAANAGGWPTYGSLNGASETICANALGCHVPSDGWDAPDGYFAVNQDDGPLPSGSKLNDFFASERISATHFFIGGNVVTNWEVFQQAMQLPESQHFGVHTWTHPYMTSLSNEDVVSELGWTMQILADNNDGQIPAFWRPPYGDVDNRVRAIAKEVFGLKTILWNFDSEDWTMGTGAAESTIMDAMKAKIMGPKSPGLLPLEHQLSDGAVDVFITIYPLLLAQGWKPMNVPDLWSLPWYAQSPDANASSVSDSAANSSSTDVFDGPPRNLLSAGANNASFCPPPPPPPCTTRSHPPPPPCTATGPPSVSTKSALSLPTAHAGAAVFRPGAHHIAPVVPEPSTAAVQRPPKLTDQGVTSEVLKQIGHPSRGPPAKGKQDDIASLKGVVKSVGAGGVLPHRRRGHRRRHEGRGDRSAEGRGTSLERRLETDQGLLYFSLV